MCVDKCCRVNIILFCFLVASSNVSTVSQGIVRMQVLPFRATKDDIVSNLVLFFTYSIVQNFHDTKFLQLS